MILFTYTYHGKRCIGTVDKTYDRGGTDVTYIMKNKDTGNIETAQKGTVKYFGAFKEKEKEKEHERQDHN